MKRFVLGLGLGLLLAGATTGRAATIVLDGGNGADYDAVGDGWFFTTPPNLPPDGVGDTGGQAFAVGYISGVLDMRAMAEFPLAALTGVNPIQIQSATLTFTIDDVIGTFGPGANFDGTASDPIAVFHYPADGTVTVADFAPAGLDQLTVVSPGVVTDASLAISGALPFNVDVTQEVKDAITNNDTAFGALFATLDSPTATSLDNLGVSGAAFPVLTIVTVPANPPVLSTAAQACQTVMAKGATKVVTTIQKGFNTCLGLVLKDYAPDSTLAQLTLDKCNLQLDESDPNSKLAKAIASYNSKIAAKCGAPLTPADLGSPCDPGAPTVAATAACVLAENREAAERLAAVQYAGACNMVIAIGLDGDFPTVCNP